MPHLAEAPTTLPPQAPSWRDQAWQKVAAGVVVLGLAAGCGSAESQLNAAQPQGHQGTEAPGAPVGTYPTEGHGTLVLPETSTSTSTTTTEATTTTTPPESTVTQETLPPQDPEVDKSLTKISVTQVGSLKIGMSGAAIGALGFATHQSAACGPMQWETEGTHDPISISFNKDYEVESLQVTSPEYSTLSGIKVGDSRQQVDEKYGDNILNAKLNGDAGPYDAKIFQSEDAIKAGNSIYFAFYDKADGRGDVLQSITLTKMGVTPPDC